MYQTVTPAQDWFFVFKSEGRPIVHHIAAWEQSDDGKLVGLIGGTKRNPYETSHLVTIPPVDGVYLHREQLSEEELEAAKRR
ncbi:methionyl-tRNA formyltransferase [Chromobacterium paludis]|uniref:Methionyl-tRNA formyltransferase n=1 Tax=Chromobacterium paludis TaxID=2605945 RepID=A0A5C1DHJ0_9NEIS|nr:methionyl-tRNA formyltransferase [Chromobacterium paludis]QEL55467.1 methionyl-tRNA formyltransferase [Chromobacterium paludis]